ncbi:MAG: peptidase T-like protein [Anaerocolumna sp.]|jgi:tripeptide aminopeptidase|nr:peptidase T-like protein [Anaerocolumna sp.]
MIKKERIISEFSELVAIDSPSFGEREIADLLKNKLLHIGFHVTEDEAGKLFGSNCGNLYGFLKGEISGTPILFSAHMDTVTPALGKKAILKADGRITSAGDTVLGADDVAGLVSILEAVRSIREDGIPHRSIEVLFTIAEEPYTKGSKAFNYSNILSKEAYVLDLSGKVGRAAFTAPSILSFKATVKGKASHAGFAPEEGIHAIAIAAKLINQVPLGRVDDDTTINIGTISGGEATNIVPEICKIEGEVRGFHHDKAIKYLHDIKGLFQTGVEEFGASLEWEETVNCIAYETDVNEVTAKRFQEACERIGVKAEFVKTFGGSDCNTFVANGISGIVLANAMNMVHSCDEYTEVDELMKCTEIVKELMISRM